MGKGGGKGGKGRVGKFLGIAAAIAFGFGAGAPWAFLGGAKAFTAAMYGLSLVLPLVDCLINKRIIPQSLRLTPRITK